VKIIEIKVECCSVIIYKFYDNKGDDWYYHHTQEMSRADLGFGEPDIKSKHISM